MDVAPRGAGAAVADAKRPARRRRRRRRRSARRRARPRQGARGGGAGAVIAQGPPGCAAATLRRRRRSRTASATTQTSRGAAKTSSWSPSSACAAIAGVRGKLCSSPSPVLVANGIATTAAAVRTTTGHAHRARIAGHTVTRTAPSTATGSSTTTAWTTSGRRGSPETNVGTISLSSISLSSGTACGPSSRRFLSTSLEQARCSADGRAEQEPDGVGDGQPHAAADHPAGDRHGGAAAAEPGADPSGEPERYQHDADTHRHPPRGRW